VSNIFSPRGKFDRCKIIHPADKTDADVGAPGYLDLAYIFTFLILAYSALSFSYLVSSFIHPYTSFMVESYNGSNFSGFDLIQHFMDHHNLIKNVPPIYEASLKGMNYNISHSLTGANMSAKIFVTALRVNSELQSALFLDIASSLDLRHQSQDSIVQPYQICNDKCHP
jgi:hypothetical protein